MGEGAARQGGDFAANLSRLGEKANYAYVVSWIRDPRARAKTVMPNLRLTVDEAGDIADSRDSRKNRPDRMAIRSDGEIDIHEHFFQPHPVGVLKRPIKQGLGHFKTDEVFICSGGVTALGRLIDIKSELRLIVGSRIVGIRYQFSELQLELRVEQRNCPVNGQWVTIIVGGIVRQRSQRERVFIEVLRVADQVEDEIAA